MTPGGGGDVSTGPAPNPLTLINPNDVAVDHGPEGRLGDGHLRLARRQRRHPHHDQARPRGADARSTTRGARRSRRPRELYNIATADELRTLVRDLTPAGEDANAAVAALGDGNTDYQDAVFNSAVSQTHNLSFSGGFASAQYRASVSYLDEEGIVTSSGQERVTGRLNANSQFLDNKLRVGLNLTSAVTNNDFVPSSGAGGGAEGGIFQNIIDFRPTLPLNDDASPDGYFEQGGSFAPRNPVALAEQLDETAQTTRTLANIQTELDLFEGLTATVNLGGDRSVGRREGYFSRFSPVTEGVGGSAFQRDLERTSVTLQTYLTYDLQSDGPHSVNVLGGYEYNDFDTREFSIQGQGLRHRRPAAPTGSTRPRAS